MNTRMKGGGRGYDTKRGEREEDMNNDGTEKKDTTEERLWTWKGRQEH